MDEATVRQAEVELTQRDPVLGKLIATQKLVPHERPSDYFAALCRSIIGQQVSVAAARAIYGRFEEHTGLQPAKVSNLDETARKAIGLSKQKSGYLRDLAAHFVKNPEVYNHLETQSDEQVIAELTEVKGIGPWTAQMFLMFTLARPDVFAPDDIGLQRGIQILYGLENVPSKKELTTIADKWRPYRTVASCHLWQSLDNTKP